MNDLRDCFSRAVYLLLAAAFCWFAVAPLHAAPAARPNIVLIMADDMGFSDLGCYGSEISTPNLDRLAARGIRFTQFYNTARCCPTRASLLTGLYPHQAGIGHMTGNWGVPAYQGYLNHRCVTIAEVLGAGGYRTYMAGKWHVGERRPHWPTDRGFDRYFGLISGASNYWRLDPKRVMALDDQPFTPPAEGFYMTDAFTDRAVRFIAEHEPAGQPFFLYVPFTCPHWPLHAWPEDIAKYRGKYMQGWDALRQRRHERMIEMGLVEEKWPLTARDEAAPAWADVEDKEARDLKMAVYAAQIDRMDQCIGRIVEALKAGGLLDETLILFLADNGGCAEEIDRGREGVQPGPKESFLSYGLPWANASNTPFRRYKHWVHEGGISTPLIAHWPAVIRNGGNLVHQSGHIIDIMATCVDAAGVSYPSTFKGHDILPMEGQSLVPVFEGRSAETHRTLFWEHEGNRAVRQDRWKLVSRHPGGWELYDLEADRTELNNLADAKPEKVAAMSRQYDELAKRCGVVPWWELTRPEVAGKPRLIEVRKIWDRAPHCAFTDLVRYKDGWYCTFREADKHAAGENGKLRILYSYDGGRWESIALLEEDGIDLRDPKLSITPEGRLMLLAGGSTYRDHQCVMRRTRVAFSEDGCQWTSFEPVLSDWDWLWRVTWHKGRAYGVAYKHDANGFSGFLCGSSDGRNWDRIVDLDVPGVSETTLRFDGDEMIALVRRERAGNNHAWVGTSQPPYTQWHWKETGYRLGGPEFTQVYDGSFWAAGRRYDLPGGAKTTFGRMTRDSFEPMITLPSGGDTSYPGMVWHDHLVYMTYYASHEGKSSIYLAKILFER